MKKWTVAIIAFLVAAFIFLVFFFPSPQEVAVNKHIKASSATLYRIINDQQAWDKLFPGQFVITKKLLNSVHINTSINNKIVSGSIMLVPQANDSTLLNWKSAVPSNDGLFSRVSAFSIAKELERKFHHTADSLERFSTDLLNTYGMNITETSTKDTALVTTKFHTSNYPTYQEIYSHIGKLKSFAAQNNAKQTGYPMLNITPTDSSGFRCMVALPVDHYIRSAYAGPVTSLRMVPGRFLTAEIKGGPQTIKRANEMMQQYFQDYKRTAMAIPFEYMVTDRLNESDTSKWVTLIYAPVF